VGWEEKIGSEKRKKKNARWGAAFGVRGGEKTGKLEMEVVAPKIGGGGGRAKTASSGGQGERERNGGKREKMT